jgi:uncharacterized repeat protein (TIGR01451 family)
MSTKRLLGFLLVAGAAAAALLASLTGGSATAAAPAPPRYQIYAAPPGQGNGAGEPSLGVDWKTGNAMFVAGFETDRVHFDDSTSPATATWTPVSTSTTSYVTSDPIGFVDSKTGRTFVSQLAGTTSLMSYSDDDGATWNPSEGGSLTSGVDHQTVGGGPFHQPAPPTLGSYPDAVYYCSQDVADALCSVSLDGGRTFPPAVPIWTKVDCTGLHGHVKVAPDGTAYVPDKNCGLGNGTPLGTDGKAAVAVSTNNGATWTVRRIPDSTNGTTDPSVGIASDGTIYEGYSGSNKHAYIAVSHDQGVTWSPSVDVGAQVGVIESVFPEVVAGDPDRAAFAFLGSTTPTVLKNGSPDPTDDSQIWHLYVASTFDGGATWTTVDATPNDPVQRGWICTDGTTCPADRNLLDFNDITVDKQGRVLVGFADGCTGACVQGPPNSSSAKATIARQSGGARLFAADDPPASAAPGTPNLSARRDSSGTVHLSWGVPDNGGSPITGYAISRSTSATGSFTQLVGTTATSYDDTTARQDTTYFYEATATNANGTSPPSPALEVDPGVSFYGQSPCAAPGVTVLTDATGDQLDPTIGYYDIQTISVAEPYFTDGSSKLVFTLKVADLSRILPDSIWPIQFSSPDGKTREWVELKTDASGLISYAYGKGSTSSTPVGAADSGSASPDGTIKIVVSDSKLGNADAAGNLVGLNAGDAITGFLSRTLPPGVTVGDNAPNDLVPSGSYTLVGNAACRANNAPTASFTATPTSGDAPLTVAFDASGSSDPDAGDTIASYTFTFGDGTAPVTQSSPKISHTYSTAGDYRATLTVRDSRGLDSATTAVEPISVEAPAPTGADLSVNGSASPNPVKAGKPLTYSFTVVNFGPEAASGVSLTDKLPANTAFVSAKPSQGSCSLASGTVTCSLGGVAKNGTATVTLVVKPRSKGTLTDTARVAATSPADPDADNNSATLSVTVS